VLRPLVKRGWIIPLRALLQTGEAIEMLYRLALVFTLLCSVWLVAVDAQINVGGAKRAVWRSIRRRRKSTSPSS
jgi:hypothetical protein